MHPSIPLTSKLTLYILFIFLKIIMLIINFYSPINEFLDPETISLIHHPLFFLKNNIFYTL